MCAEIFETIQSNIVQYSRKILAVKLFHHALDAAKNTLFNNESTELLQQNVRASFFQGAPRTRQARNEEDESVTFSTFRDWVSLCESHHQQRMQLLLLQQAWTYKDSVEAKC